MLMCNRGVGSLWEDKALEGQTIVYEQWFAPSKALFAQNLPTPLMFKQPQDWQFKIISTELGNEDKPALPKDITAATVKLRLG